MNSIRRARRKEPGPRSLCQSKDATCGRVCDRDRRRFEQDARDTAEASTDRCAPRVNCRGTALVLHKPRAARPSSLPDNSPSPVLPAGDTCHSMSAQTRAAGRRVQRRAMPGRAASVPPHDCRSIRDAQVRSAPCDRSTLIESGSAYSGSRQTKRLLRRRRA